MASPYADNVIADGAVAYWRLDEASGNALSQVGNFPGTVTGGVTRGQPGALSDGNTAMAFDGTSGQILTVANVPRQTPFTLEAWIKTTANDQRPILYGPYAGGAEQWQTGIASGAAHVYVVNEAQTLTNSVGGVRLINDNQWHHMVFIFESASTRIYVDGGLDKTHTNVFPVLGITLPAEIGYGSNPSLFWPGLLDEVAIYHTALTPEQIAAHYALATTSPIPAWHDLRYRYCRFVRAPGWRRSA